MTIVLAYADTPVGHAALRYAAAMSRRTGEPLVLTDAEHHGHPSAERAMEIVGDGEPLEVSVGVSDLHDPADRVVQVAQLLDAGHIVLGLRHRSPVGKLILGSTAQRILLEATCPVICVKES